MILSKFKQSFNIFLKGLLMGSADVIPGVSGGTIAFITGIYYRLIHSIKIINLNVLKRIIDGNFKKAISEIKSYDWNLFLPLGLGIITSIFLLSGLIKYLLQNYTASTFSLFFGLIATSAYLIYKHMNKIKFKELILLIFGFIFAFLLSGATTLSFNHSLPIIFLSAMVAICAMILPGISGAFILLLLGQYEFLVGKIHELDFIIIGTFGLGAIIGLLSFSKILDKLLNNYHNLTISFLVGLMLGSLRTPWIEINSTEYSILNVILFVIIGSAIVLFIEKKSNKK